MSKPTELRDDVLEEIAQFITYRGQCAVQMINADERIEEKKAYAWDCLQHAMAIRARKSKPAPNKILPCKGKNCGSTDGTNHSVECIAEHEATIGPALNDSNEETDCVIHGKIGGVNGDCPRC